MVSLKALVASAPGVMAATCPMLGCDVSGSNSFQSGFFDGPVVASNMSVAWSTVAADGPITRLLCTSDDTFGPDGPDQLLVCGVNRSAPDATGVPGLVALHANGSLAWEDYEISEVTGHPVRSRFTSGGASVASDRLLVGIDQDGKSYGPPRDLEPRIEGGSFSLTSTDNEIFIVASRGEARLGSYFFNSVPHAGISLESDEQTFRAIGTPVVNMSRVYILAQKENTTEAESQCAVFAIDARRADVDRLHLQWVHNFRCPPAELRDDTTEEKEIPVVHDQGLLFFPAATDDGQLQMLVVEDAGDSAVLRASAPLSDSKAWKLRSLTLLPSSELLATFDAPTSVLLRLAADGTELARYELPADFVVAAGSRATVVASSNGVDSIVTMATKKGSSKAWLVGLNLGKDVEVVFTLALGELDGVAKHGLQVVPLKDALVATVGGTVFAVKPAASLPVLV